MDKTLSCPHCAHSGTGEELMPGLWTFFCSRCQWAAIFNAWGDSIPLPPTEELKKIPGGEWILRLPRYSAPGRS